VLQHEEAARAIMSEDLLKIQEQRTIAVEERGKRHEQREINRETFEMEYAKKRDQRD